MNKESKDKIVALGLADYNVVSKNTSDDMLCTSEFL